MISRPSIRRALTFLALACCANLSTANAWENFIPGSRYSSARAKALGNAFLPLGDDGASALFYNPAAIGKIRSPQLEPANVAFSVNGGLTDSLGANSYKAYSLDTYFPQLQAAHGSFQGASAQITPTFAAPGFALGMLLSDDFGATSDAAGNVRYRTLYQFIPAAAVGVRLAGGIVRLGYSLQWVNEAVGDNSVPNGTIPLGYNQALAQGSGFSHTFGAALTLPITYLPQLDLVVRNFGSTTYSGNSIIPFATNSTGKPGDEQMTMDASFSLQPKIDSGIFANLVFELRDMTARTGITPWGRACAGMELSLRNFLILRGGWGEGYPAAGVAFKIKKGEFGLSWYSEEIGTTYQGQRDIRFMFQYSMRAF